MQSAGLSAKLTALGGGRRLTQDSLPSEGTLGQAISVVMRAAQQQLDAVRSGPLAGARINHQSTLSLFDCQQQMHAFFPDEYPIPGDGARGRSMRPDGGIVSVTVAGRWHPLLVTEDKIQGTNDIRFAKELGRQATGNAIERAAKNIRGAEMAFLAPDQKLFPYIVFAAGCDFHSSETIASRLEMMNYGVPNAAFEVTPSNVEVTPRLIDRLEHMSCKKRFGGRAVASIFIKTHKWDEMPHGSSNWSTPERVLVCGWAMKQSMDQLFSTYRQSS
jgi:hypothetical protein